MTAAGVPMLNRSKAAFKGRVSRDLGSIHRDGVWSLAQKIALACRVLFEEGHESGLAGQITCRGAAEATAWTTRFELGFDEVCASNLILVDDDLKVRDGEGIPNPATRFHFSIYADRPDVACIIHTHAPHASALSMTGQPFMAAHMDTMALFEDSAHLAEWPGVPVSDQEGPLISAALGSKRSILLANHGLLVAAASVEEAACLAIAFERGCRLQLLASRLGPVHEVERVLGREAHDFMSKKAFVDAVFAYRARRVARGRPECLD